MGLIISKFREKETSVERLEKINKEIKSIQDFQRNTVERRKRIVWCFRMFSIVVFVASILILYFNFNLLDTQNKIIFIVVLLLAPVFIYLLKRLLTRYYNNLISKQKVNLVILQNEKKEILEQIMSTETYNIARSILEKYAPEEVNNVDYSSNDTDPIIPPDNTILDIFD